MQSVTSGAVSNILGNYYRIVFNGIALHEGVNTHLNVNAGGLGRTLLLICSAQWAAEDNTSSAIYVVRCGYDNNNWEKYTILEGHVSSDFKLNLSVNTDGELILQSQLSTWYVSILSNKQ